MNICLKQITDLINYEYNNKSHPDKQIDLLANSIKEYGFNTPVIIDQNNVIIAGHGRVLAGKKLGLTEVPCIQKSDLTATQIKKYRLLDNKIAELAEDNIHNIKLELEELQDIDLNELYYLDIQTLDQQNKEEIEDEAPEAKEAKVIQLGDIIQLGEHRLMCGDSTKQEDFDKLLAGEKNICVFSDPPYGIDVVQGNKVGGGGETKFGKKGGDNFVDSKQYSVIIGDDTTDTTKAHYLLMLENGIKNICLWGGNYYTDFIPPSRCWLIWDKEMTGNFSEAEMCWTSFTKGGIKVFKFLWNGLSREGNRKDELKSRIHPTQKPVGLYQMIFERFDGFNKYYDGFLGSGTTIIASEKTGRIAFGHELDPSYCEVIIKRYYKYTEGKKSIKCLNRDINLESIWID